MAIEGTVMNGMIVLNPPQCLPEGARVEVVLEPTLAEAALPQEPFLTEEICAPCSIPWPEGKATRALRVTAPLPSPHGLPNEE